MKLRPKQHGLPLAVARGLGSVPVSGLPDSGGGNSSHAHRAAHLRAVSRQLVGVAAGRAGALRVRLHETSLFHNLWKLWRRSVCLLEQCLLSASMAHGGLYFTLETERHRLWQPRGVGGQPHGSVHGPAAGVASGCVDHAHCVPCPVRPGAGQCLGTDWFCRRLGSFCGGAFPLRSFFIAISTIEA